MGYGAKLPQDVVHKIRDNFQTIIDKNLGSTCIVTTITAPKEEILEEMKRGQDVFISGCQNFECS